MSAFFICKGNAVCEGKTVGLVHYPTTLSPVSGSVSVTTQCADNAHISNSTCPNVTCTSNCSWSGETPQCQCDEGYQSINIGGTQNVMLKSKNRNLQKYMVCAQF